MSTPATHQCDACGGTGGLLELPEVNSRSRGWKRAKWFVCEDCYDQDTMSEYDLYRVPYRDTSGECAACKEPFTPCPVCLGAGSFPDRMPAADALADAETLRLVLGGTRMGG